jgi:NAD(P)H-hydrate epimerase
MKILSSQQLKACDQYTIQASGITSAQLMETAASACVQWLIKEMPRNAMFIVLCGPGNNGGDGLAITRLLHHADYAAKAFLLQPTTVLSPDCQLNYERLKKIDENLVAIVPENTFITDLGANIIIIDAIFGTGINRRMEGWMESFIKQVNSWSNYKIAIDMPSGLSADTLPQATDTILQANETLSFQFYKRTFLHKEGGKFTGEVHVLDIGLHPTFIHQTTTHYFTIDKKQIQEIHQPRNPFSHKGNYGHVLLAGGSMGMMGAITLSAKAALRSGAGKVTALIPEMGYTIFQSQLPEAMFISSGETHLTEIRNSMGATATGIGPGMGLARQTVEALAQFIEEQKEPMLLDADALNILATRKELLHKLPHNSILTPHPKEFERLFGETSNSFLRVEKARTQAMLYNIIIVLKDHHTVIVTPDGSCWYNLTGNAGMATAGSGDVLAGIITSLLAQGYEPHHAAIFGVYLHGLAGDFAAIRHSKETMIASDIIEHLGKAFQTI